MDLYACLRFLVPNAEFGLTGNEYSGIEWLDARPLPTEAQCAAAWPAVQAQQAAETQAAATAVQNESTLRQQAEAALAELRVERDRSYAGLSAAAAIALVVPALKLVIRVQIGVIRLLLRKLDGTS